MEKISITIPKNPIYIKSIRLFSASVASDLGFDIEKVEDVRVVVSEAINYKFGDNQDIKINFKTEEGYLEIEVIGKDKTLDDRALKMRDLILKELADEVEITDESILLKIKAK